MQKIFNVKKSISWYHGTHKLVVKHFVIHSIHSFLWKLVDSHQNFYSNVHNCVWVNFLIFLLYFSGFYDFKVVQYLKEFSIIISMTSVNRILKKYFGEDACCTSLLKSLSVREKSNSIQFETRVLPVISYHSPVTYG